MPRSVYLQLVGQAATKHGTEAIRQADWIQSMSLGQTDLLERIPLALHDGEREAIALALQLRARLLIDDAQGRKVARQHGVQVLGALRVILNAKRLGLIQTVGPILDALRESGYWIEGSLCQETLKEAGEG